MSRQAVVTLRMSGELDLLRRDEVRGTLNVASGGPSMLIDLSEVTYADSSILAELLRFHNEASQYGVDVALVIVSKQFARLVHYAGLAHAFRIFDSTDAARAYLAKSSAS